MDWITSINETGAGVLGGAGRLGQPGVDMPDKTALIDNPLALTR